MLLMEETDVRVLEEIPVPVSPFAPLSYRGWPRIKHRPKR